MGREDCQSANAPGGDLSAPQSSKTCLSWTKRDEVKVAFNPAKGGFVRHRGDFIGPKLPAIVEPIQARVDDPNGILGTGPLPRSRRVIIRKQDAGGAAPGSRSERRSATARWPFAECWKNMRSFHWNSIVGSMQMVKTGPAPCRETKGWSSQPPAKSNGKECGMPGANWWWSGAEAFRGGSV